MTRLPEDTFARCPHPPFAPSARRTLELFGRTVELVWLPERRSRQGVPGAERPPFVPDGGARIVTSEATWIEEGLALTPNRFPFAARQALLWSTRPIREPDEEMLLAACAFATEHGCTALLNSIGAAASLARAHLHLVDERLDFLTGLPTEPLTAEFLAGIADVDVVRAALPFPACLLGVRGDPTARARALRRLLDLRTSTAFNAVDDGETAWLMPRSAVEVTAPDFPQALGAAELWGRWCFLDQEAFERATPEGLSAALLLAGFARCGAAS